MNTAKILLCLGLVVLIIALVFRSATPLTVEVSSDTSADVLLTWALAVAFSGHRAGLYEEV
jgi:hypothetical protein